MCVCVCVMGRLWGWGGGDPYTAFVTYLSSVAHVFWSSLEVKDMELTFKSHYENITHTV